MESKVKWLGILHGSLCLAATGGFRMWQEQCRAHDVHNHVTCTVQAGCLGGQRDPDSGRRFLRFEGFNISKDTFVLLPPICQMHGSGRP